MPPCGSINELCRDAHPLSGLANAAFQKVLNAIKEGGASFLSLDVRKPNLEEVFLKLTGEALREDPPEMEAK